jgi:hypothetical protein
VNRGLVASNTASYDFVKFSAKKCGRKCCKVWSRNQPIYAQTCLNEKLQFGGIRTRFFRPLDGSDDHCATPPVLFQKFHHFFAHWKMVGRERLLKKIIPLKVKFKSVVEQPLVKGESLVAKPKMYHEF